MLILSISQLFFLLVVGIGLYNSMQEIVPAEDQQQNYIDAAGGVCWNHHGKDIVAYYQ